MQSFFSINRSGKETVFQTDSQNVQLQQVVTESEQLKTSIEGKHPGCPA